MKQGKIFTGIGGWTFEPWRGVFYPKGLVHAKELSYAAEHLTSIEINGTFYRTQKPAVFRKWASEVPDGFIFAVKGVRYATNRRVLAEAGDSVKRFLESGVTELGTRLGPLLWQFQPTKKFDEAISENSWSTCLRHSTAGNCATSSKCGTTASRRQPSSNFCASSISPPSLPITCAIRTSPT
jgi:uncharacterized protein YecE (DUF72 family)